MISVTEALQIIDAANTKTSVKSMRIEKTLGFVLAEDITAPINMPPFRQSAMDGYAIRWSDDASQVYTVIDESKAGDSKHIVLKANEAARIFTGAKVPDTADTVVMQEHVEVQNAEAKIMQHPKKGTNVRPIGEQVTKGEVVLKQGLIITEAAIGFLAGLGIRKITVYQKPKISILVTGNELQAAGTVLEDGEIYESNAIMLKMALKRFGFNNVKIFRAKDNLKTTKKHIKKGLKFADVLLISGGISVGDYDFVKEALSHLKVKELFYKINQKPGKPLWFGQKKEQFVFALPGNPASALTCFYVYVLPLLNKRSGGPAQLLKSTKAKSSSALKNTTGKTLFLKALVSNNEVDFLQGQQSSMLHSFATSNALAIIPEAVETVNKGDAVQCLILHDYGN